jgi:hypothetical protein
VVEDFAPGVALTGPPDEVLPGLGAVVSAGVLPAAFWSLAMPAWKSLSRGSVSLRSCASGLTMKLLVIRRLSKSSLTAASRALRAFSNSGVPGRAVL